MTDAQEANVAADAEASAEPLGERRVELRSGAAPATRTDRHVARAVIGITGTPALPAKIRFAIDLHRKHGTEINAVGVIDVARVDRTGPVPIGGIAIAREMRDRRRAVSVERATRALQQFRQGCEEAGVPATTSLVEDEPVAVINQRARFNDLVVLPVNGWFTYGVVSHAEGRLADILSAGAGPVLAIGEDYAPAADVVVGLDGSLSAANSFKALIQLGLWPEAKLHLVHSVDEAWMMRDAGASEMIDEALAYAERHGRAAEGRIVTGGPVEVLRDVIRSTGAGAVVIGSDRRRLFANSRLTAVTKGLVTGQAVSVLVAG